ncbi:MAG: hypothetical protein HYX63_00385 [Gammaproteobacteria bacterium]|nr:hypothetical protein [Gammaproteobacteria bacterium]
MSAKPITTRPGCDLYDHALDWLPFAGIENLELTLCDIDEERQVVDSEGGGPDGAVVFYSMRCDGARDVLEIMDEAATVQATLTMDDVRAAWAAQRQAQLT